MSTVKQSDDLSTWTNLELLDVHTRLTRQGYWHENPIGRSDAYLAYAERNRLVLDELRKRLGTKEQP